MYDQSFYGGTGVVDGVVDGGGGNERGLKWCGGEGGY